MIKNKTISIKDLHKFMIQGEIEWLEENDLGDIELVEQVNGKFTYTKDDGKVMVNITYYLDRKSVECNVSVAQWHYVEFNKKFDEYDNRRYGNGWYRIENDQE